MKNSYTAYVAKCTAVFLIPLLTLFGCGKANDDSHIRLINATTDISSLSLFADDDKVNESVAADSMSGYADVKSTTNFQAKLKRSGSETVLNNSTQNLARDYHYLAVAWGREGNVNLTFLGEEESEPSSGQAKVRVFNTATDAGPVDVYLSDASSALSSISPDVSNVDTGKVSGFSTVNKGTYRLRVTAASDKDDLRLDTDSIVVGDKARITIIVQSGAGGVLTHSLIVSQQSDLTVRKNASARVRATSSISSSGVVTTKIANITIANSLTSPSVGAYFLVPAGAQKTDTTINGGVTSSSTFSFIAGGDYTVMSYGSVASPKQSFIVDDNRVPLTSGKAKIRLVHGAESYSSASMTYDSIAVTSEIPLGSSSASTTVNPNSGNALIEVTAPSSPTPLYTTEKSGGGTTGATIDAKSVYTIFLLGGNTTPRGIIRKDR
jgi:Domain of unknown function (DUF4397)